MVVEFGTPEVLLTNQMTEVYIKSVYDTNIDCFLFVSFFKFEAWLKLFPLNDLKTMTMPLNIAST